jgi:fibronectin type 3 domain-containing protein
VTAVAADGTESPASGSIRVSVYVPGAPPHCPPTPPVQLTVLDLTSSAVTLGWLQTDPPAEYRITVAGRTITTRDAQIRLGGLAPNETHTISAVNFGCLGFSNRGSIQVTTPDGPTQWPNQPTDVAVTARTDSSATVSWSAPVGGTQVAYYAIYRGTTRIATTTDRFLRFTGLWRGESFPLAVAAIGHDGAESQHSAPITVSAAACDDEPPAPEAVTATAVSASSVELRWLSRTEAASYTVLEGDRVVANLEVPSARITGLPSATKHRFRVVTNLPGSCGTTPPSARVKVKTLAGPGARPGTPTQVQSVGTAMTPYGDVAIRWTAPADAAELTYRIYEGATLIGRATQTSFATRVLPATSHLFTVVAVDVAGNESAQSAPVRVWGSFLPLP